MIRNPLQSALARTRPDIVRVADGISTSLRSFSVAARLAAEEKSNNSNSNSSGRSRATGAVDNLIHKAESSVQNLRRSAPATAPASRVGPNVIRVSSLRGRGRGGARGGFLGERTPQQGGQGGGRAAPIDGLTLGLTGAREPRQFTPREGGPFERRSEGSGGRGGGFRGRGGSRGGSRGARGDRGGRGGRGRGGRGGRGRRDVRDGEGESQDDSRANQLDPLFVTKEEALYTKTLEEGVVHTFDPTFNLESLHGFAPAIAASKSPFAYAATAITQARTLGGGRPYSDNERMMPEDAAEEYTKGTGMFFSDPEARAWAQEHSGVEFKNAPEETKQAVLDAALLGKYDAPKAVKLSDTLATVQNYMKKDTRIYGQPGRDIHDKIKSLLPGQAATAASGKKETQKPKTK